MKSNLIPTGSKLDQNWINSSIVIRIKRVDQYPPLTGERVGIDPHLVLYPTNF